MLGNNNKACNAGNKPRSFASALALVGLLLPGCVVKDWWLNRGSQLTSFKAENGAYFPGFIYDYFDAAKDFTAQHPTLGEAQQNVALIQVKQLNPLINSQNEANLSWSADGIYLSFEQEEMTQRKIMLKDLSNQFVRELSVKPKASHNFLDGLVSNPLQSYNSSLSWSKDSTRFAFMSNGGVGEYNIYVGGINREEEVIAESPSKDGYANWHPKTQELVFVSARTGNGDLYTVDLSNKKLTRLTESDDVELFPEWSPDGKMVVFSQGSAKNHRIVLLKRNGEKWSKELFLTTQSFDALRPTFSPNGKLLAFYVKGPDERWDIAVLSIENITPSPIKNLRSKTIVQDVVVDLNTGPSWSPDGSKVFYVKKDQLKFNPIYAYDLYSGRRYHLKTGTRMNRDIMMSRLGVLSFRAQNGAWDKVYVALTNQGLQIQGVKAPIANVVYAEE